MTLLTASMFFPVYYVALSLTLQHRRGKSWRAETAGRV
jgi:hypothetical protein